MYIFIYIYIHIFVYIHTLLPATPPPKDTAETNHLPVIEPDTLAGRRLPQKRLPTSTKLPEKQLQHTVNPTASLPGLHLVGSAPFASQTPPKEHQNHSFLISIFSPFSTSQYFSKLSKRQAYPSKDPGTYSESTC